MPELRLTERQQGALRTLLQVAPVPGSPIPPEHVLATIADLVPCDAIGVALADGRGRVLDGVELPRGYSASAPRDPAGHDAPFYLGVMHWSRFPLQAEQCQALHGMTDGVAVGVRNGPDCVAQLFVDRKASYFSDHDLAVLNLITPLLQRLLRERPTPQLPASLTIQERRVLTHVAAGRSNAQIAEHLFIAPSTVRKHLENTFRKLGVTSRLAAVATLQGRDLPDLDLRARIERLELTG